MAHVLLSSNKSPNESNRSYKKRIRRQTTAAKKRKQKRLQVEYEDRIRNRERVQRHREKMANRDQFNKEEFFETKCTFSSWKEREEAIIEFERRSEEVTHNNCPTCHRTSINLKIISKHQQCDECVKFCYTEDKLVEEGLLPVWFNDNGNPQYHVPEALSCLRDCEKMLIQKLNTHVPAHHMKYGVLGVQGHVCAFPQEIGDVCNILPRLPDNCSIVRYIKESNSRVVGGTSTKLFRVRRFHVLNALYWLKKYHIGYNDIVIEKNNLAWMGEEGEKEITVTEEVTVEEDNDEMDDIGPSPAVNVAPRESEDVNITYNGVLLEDSPLMASKIDRELAGIIESANTNGDVVLNWPSIGETAVNELGNNKIFTLAYPWLFPGGVGDFRDFRKRNINPGYWAKRLIQYEDARFAVDKFFCFYALNYTTRRRNHDRGNFFLNKFASGCNEDIDSLREAIANGKSNFINEISYFCKEIPGSDGYWRFKRDELHTWINHHVERGNGMPSFFITLSCADYYWADIIRLVKERHFIATGETLDFSGHKSGKVKIINDHAGVVQEYFQKRVINWLETVGKVVFDITHYWIRYEFAPSRGQIHAHMICVSKDQSMQEALYILRDKENEQAEVLSEWAHRKIQLSACYFTDENKSNNSIGKKEEGIKAVSMRYRDTCDTDDDLRKLKDVVEMHQCNGYCLRESTKIDKEKYCELHHIKKVPTPFNLKTCRFGAGTEKTKNTGDTPGFKLLNKPQFFVGASGFKKLQMVRNHVRVNQVSDTMLSSWRGNCDVQVFVYESNPKRPQYDEIARVTDYTVGYACKGGQRLKDEKEQMIGLSNSYCDQNEDGNARTLSKKLLNRASSSRFISKPECMILLLELGLVACSDKFRRINVNGNVRITKNKTSCSSSFVDTYMKRPEKYKNKTLHEYFHESKNKNRGPHDNWVVPHYTGVSVKPTYPATHGYAKFIATVHKIWEENRPNFPLYGWEDDYYEYINNAACPEIVKLQHMQATERTLNKALNVCSVKNNDPKRDENMDPDMEALLDLIGMRTIPEMSEPDDILIDYGKKYDWLSASIDRRGFENGKKWLEKQIKLKSEESTNNINLPMWKNREGVENHYEIENLTDDQKDIMAYVLHGIKRWLDCDPGFSGIQMLINGKGGTGKTVLLKTITSVVRRLFQSKTAVVVSGPTGACSCHAGGKTDHATFCLNASNINETSVNQYTRDKLIPEFRDTVVFLFDERSMRESRVLSRMELTARYCAHGGNKTQTPWGGVPIVIQLGDDMQLPSYGKGTTFIPLPGCGYCRPPVEHNKMVLRGHQVHMNFAKFVMELPVIKRQTESEKEMIARLERTRNDDLNENDVEFFRGLHIRNREKDVVFSKELEKRTDNALYVFANCQPRDDHNVKQMEKISKKQNIPVALFKSLYEGGPNKGGKAIKNHFRDDKSQDRMKSPDRSRFSVGCKVAIGGRNILPEWGLFNGAIGTVKEIHFSIKDDGSKPNPNHGDFCDYVVVEFQGYKGPAWDKNEPKQVPIPVLTERCKHKCCIKTFVPLELCFATTIHKVEGLTVGPSKEGSEPNSAECMVVDPGTLVFESNCPGLFYTSYSRATTDAYGNPLKSAILFMGDHITEHRLIRMTVSDGNKKRKHLRVLRRDNWIKWLKKNTRDSGLSEEKKTLLFMWATHTKLNKNKVRKHIANCGYQSCV